MTFQKTLARSGWMLLLLLSSCSSEPRKTEKSDEASTTAASAHLHTVEGFARLAGSETPTATRVENSTDPEVCGRVHTLENLVVSADNRGVQDVIVALTD